MEIFGSKLKMAWISDNYGFDYDCEVTYQKVSLKQLSAELSQTVIYGIIIAKQDLRRIDSRKRKYCVFLKNL